MAIFNSHVKLPEGNSNIPQEQQVQTWENNSEKTYVFPTKWRRKKSDPDFEDGSQVQRMGPWIITCQVTVKPRITSFYMVFLWFSKDSWAESESPSSPRSEPIDYIPTRIRKNIWKNHMPAVTTLSIAIDPKLLAPISGRWGFPVTPMAWEDLGPTTSTWVKKTSDRWNIPYYIYIYILCVYI